MLIWHMPIVLLLLSTTYVFIYALWPILWLVFNGLWLYNLTQDTGKFDLLRRWMEGHASGDASIQAILVASGKSEDSTSLRLGSGSSWA